MEELIVRALAKRKGIPEDEAKLLLESLKQEDDYGEIRESLAAIADMGEVVSRFPASVQPLAFPLFAQAMGGGGSSSRTDRIAENIALISTAVRAAYGNNDGTKVIEDLRKEIQDLKEDKTKKEREALLQQVEQSFQGVTDYIKALEDKIKQLEKDGWKDKDELDALSEYVTKVERTKEKLKELGLIREKEEEDIDFSKAEEVLKKAGYKIERPMTWDSLQKYIEENMKKVREEAKKEAMEELKIQEKRETMLMDLISTLSGAVFESLKGKTVKASEAGAVAEKIVERVGAWKQQRQEQQGQGHQELEQLGQEQE